VVLLAVWGALGTRVSDRPVRAFLAAGAVLAVLALVSPLEVRYLYALTLPLAILAGEGVARAFEGPARGRALVLLLCALQAGIAYREIAFDLLTRYRTP
jgi:hypothetical protein